MAIIDKSKDNETTEAEGQTQSDTSVRSNANIDNVLRKQTQKQYSWMLDGESVAIEIPVKHVIYLVRKRSRGQPGGHSSPEEKIKNKKKPHMAVKKTNVTHIVVTDQRVIFTTKGELFADKSYGRFGFPRRQFFFYDKDAFEKYLEYAAKNNERVISAFKNEHPKFAASYDKNGMSGTLVQMYSTRLQKAGYISALFFIDSLQLGTEKEYKKGTMGKSLAGKLLKSLGPTQAMSGFFDGRKKGVNLGIKTLDLSKIERSNAYLERGKTVRAKLNNIGLIRPTGFFLLPDKKHLDETVELINDIVDKVVEMKAFTDKDTAVEAVTEKYLGKGTIN